jgi:hypothetical protein
MATLAVAFLFDVALGIEVPGRYAFAFLYIFHGLKNSFLYDSPQQQLLPLTLRPSQ